MDLADRAKPPGNRFGLRSGVLLASRHPRWRGMVRCAVNLLAGLGILLATGCSVLRAPSQAVRQIIPGDSNKQADPLELQLQLQRYADEFGAQTTVAIDKYVERTGTEVARIDGMKWKLGAVSASLMIASGPHPKGNMLDLVSLATLTRMTVEQRAADSTNAAALRPWLDTSRIQETNIWTIAISVLKSNQVSELRAAILDWHAQHPEVHDAFFARPREFASLVKIAKVQNSSVDSVFSLVNLDPAAGLDPAVREVTLSRLFAERAMYTAQRLPFILRMQATLLTEQVAEQSAIRSVLTNAAQFNESLDRISHALQTTSVTAGQLPDRITTERREIMAALEQQEGKLNALSAQVNLALQSGERMSSSLSVTITNFDALMKRFGVGEPSTNSAPDTNSPPFNILDYGEVAQRVEGMAREVNAMLNTVNATLPQLERLSQTATAEAQQVVDHGFRWGLILVATLLVGSLGAGLAFRFLSAKMTRSSRTPPPPGP